MNTAENTDIVVLTNDQDIAMMLSEEGITLSRPTPPNDVTHVAVHNTNHYWIVVRFWHPGDEGYLAYGVHESTSPEVRKALAREILAGLTAQAHAWRHPQSLGVCRVPRSKVPGS